jgi:hypothetical protein
MLKTYGQISRFMEGLRINYSPKFVYLKDKSGQERFGEMAIMHPPNGSSHLLFFDLSTEKALAFEGNWLDAKNPDDRKFSWFPGVKEVGVLYDGFDNDLQRHADMNHNFIGFLANELFYETIIRKMTWGGSKEKEQLAQRMREIAPIYGASLELLYAGLNGDRDVLMLVNKPTKIKGNAVPPLGIESIKLDRSLDGFLNANPIVKAHLTDGQISENGIKYDTPEKIMERLRDYILEEVLDAGYGRFNSERDAMARLFEFRKVHSKEELEDRMKTFDRLQTPLTISLRNERDDLRRARQLS